MIKAVQQQIAQISSEMSDVVEETKEATALVETRLQCTTSNDVDSKKQQVWLAKVNATIKLFKSNALASVDEANDISSDDYDVTENTEIKFDRQPEWLAAVRLSVQKYKDTIP